MNVSTLSDKPGCCRRRFVSSVTIQTSLTANHMKASLSRLNYTQHRFNRTYAWMLEASRGWVRAGPQTQSSPTCVSSLLLCPFSLFVLAWRTQGQLVPPQHTPYRMCQVRTGPPPRCLFTQSKHKLCFDQEATVHLHDSFSHTRRRSSASRNHKCYNRPTGLILPRFRERDEGSMPLTQVRT